MPIGKEARKKLENNAKESLERLLDKVGNGESINFEDNDVFNAFFKGAVGDKFFNDFLGKDTSENQIRPALRRSPKNGTSRREWKWTPLQFDKLNKVKDILQELEVYKPLTLRQVYYQMVSKGFIENKVSEYTMMSNLLKWARIDGYIPWRDIEDRVRAFHNAAGWDNRSDFIRDEISFFLEGYCRDLLQSQEKYIEIWIEKDALSSIFKKVTMPYCVSVVVCRGFSSISFLNDFRERLISQNRPAVMLYFGDFDPSGMEMLEAMKTTLKYELDMTNVDFKRIALTKDDIFTYHLPHKPEALKKTDTRAKKHLEVYGELAVELDALSPDVLEAKITDAIEVELDIDLFNSEVREHNKEIEDLKKIRARVIETMSGDSP
jgi:hypothetical protein